MHPTSLRRAAGLAVALLFPSCASRPFGPSAVTPARLGYNEAIGRSADEQLLLNIVRLRYRDNPVFLDVSSVVAQYGRSASFSASALLRNPGGLAEGSAGIEGEMSENPVITLSPIRGEEFTRRLLSPISATDIVALAFSGWSVERLMLCCVQEIRGLPNAISASGPTPDYAPRFEDFHMVAALMRGFQISGALAISLDAEGDVMLDLKRGVLGSEAQDEVAAFVRALGLDPAADRLRLVPPTAKLSESDVPYLGRSLLGVLYYLSQAVEVPVEHETKGWVTITKEKDGNRFDWRRVTGRIFRVQSSPDPPADAAVRVRYRDTWFWVADNDLHSKSTLSLVSLLFTLKAGDATSPTPLIAISN